jgi:hypothetical protein
LTSARTPLVSAAPRRSKISSACASSGVASAGRVGAARPLAAGRPSRDPGRGPIRPAGSGARNTAHADSDIDVLYTLRPGRRLGWEIEQLTDDLTDLFALAIDGSFDHRRVSTAHLIREGERWNALGAGEAGRIVAATLADFAKALDRVAVPPGVHASTAAQLAWNVERLQAGGEIGERPTGYRRRRSRS